MTSRAAPQILPRDEWERIQAEHRVLEKAHTRAGDALAAKRRRLPMTPVEDVGLVGADGPVRLHDVFDGRDELVVYTFMWHHGASLADQCEGCTFAVSQITEAMSAYLADRGVSFAVLSDGAWPELEAYRAFMGWTMPWYSSADAQHEPALAGGGGYLRSFLRDGDGIYLTFETTARGNEPLLVPYALLDRTAYGRREPWEDSPDGWPEGEYGWWRRDGRPIAQWLRTDRPAGVAS